MEHAVIYTVQNTHSAASTRNPAFTNMPLVRVVVSVVGILLAASVCALPQLTLHAPPDALQSEPLPLTLLVFVFSTSSRSEVTRRQVLRKTWLSWAKRANAASNFVIATGGFDDNTLAKFGEEQRVHDDLVLLPNFVDAYSNLTLKTLWTFTWAYQRAPQRASYVMKCDSDTFVRLDTILAELHARPHAPTLYWGHAATKVFVCNQAPCWSGDHFVYDPAYNFSNYTLPAMQGGGYILGSDLVEYISSNHARLRIGTMNEDDWMGVWLTPIAHEAQPDDRFVTYYRHLKGIVPFSKQSCRNDGLVFKRVDDDHVARLFALANAGAPLCKAAPPVRDVALFREGAVSGTLP